MTYLKKLRPLLVQYLNGYRQFFDWSARQWKFVHRRVAEKIFGRIPRAHEVHHVDGNKLNNRPSNLQVLPRDAHIALHRINRDSLRSKQPRVSRSAITLNPKSTSLTRPILPGDIAFKLSCKPEPPTLPISGSVPLLSGLLSGLTGLGVRGGSNGACCSRCGGSGYLPQYAHVEGGICFLCGNNGGTDCYDECDEKFGDIDDDPDGDGSLDDYDWDPRYDDSNLYDGDDYDPGYYDNGYDSG